MTATPARVQALEVMRAVRRGELADRALFRALERVPPRDRGWTQELVYGTLRLRGRLDHQLEQLSRRPFSDIDPDLLDILRLGAYQLLEMHSVPAYAAVSESVELARGAAGAGASGFVNGVLRALRRSEGRLAFPAPSEDLVSHLSTHGSHPRWLVQRWIHQFGGDAARALVEANNRRPELYLRPIRDSVDRAQEALAGAGISSEPVPDARALRIPPGSVASALAVVPAVVQDPAASLVVDYVDAPADARIADVAAAPGGKALALASGCAHTSPRRVVAADASWFRMQRLRENVERLGAVPLDLLVADARAPALREGAFDVVLLDAPCTGTGTFRRHPDARWRITPRDLHALAHLQHEMLDAAAALVRPGGLLVYATCSLEPEENEQQVQSFLERTPAFRVAPPSATVAARFLDEHGRLRVLPHETDFDGAFAARLRRS